LKPDQFVNELKQVISEKKDQYEQALVRLALRREEGEIKINFGRIDFLFKDDPKPNGVSLDYNNFILTQFVRRAEEIPGFLENLLNGGTTNIDLFQSVRCDFEQEIRWDFEELTSNYDYNYIRSDFPCFFYSSRIDDKGIDRRLILAGKKLRPYPNISYAIHDFLNLNNSKHRDKYLNESRFIVVAPDFRVKIKNTKIIRNKVRIELDCKNIDEKEIFAQFYLDGETNTEIPIKNKSAEAEAFKEPNEIMAVILDRKSGEILDYKQVDFRWRSEPDSSIQIEDSEDIVKEWIKRGEDDHVEFKEGLGHADDIIKTVVAFANTNGGVIIFGVRDDGSVSGFNQDISDTQKNIERMIASKCDPPVKFTTHRIEDYNITYIKISKGDSKLYAVTNGPIYVRRGASDIFIRPSELVERFSGRSDSILPGSL